MKSSMKICPQCGRKYSDIIMRCPACEKDLIDVNEGQGDNAQQLIEEREQLEAMQRRLKLQQQELKEEQQRFAEQQKLEEQRKFAEQQKIKEEQQKRKKRQQKIVVSSVSASAVIVALGAVVLYNRPWEQIPALSPEQSTESIMKSDTTTAYSVEDILPTVPETPTTALSAPSAPAETETSATIPINPSAIAPSETIPMETAAQEPSQIPAPTPEPREIPAMLQEMHMAETEEDIDGTGFYIGLVTDFGGVNDGSFNQSAWEGLQRAGEAFGCEVKYIESKGDADYVPNIESFLDEDYDLIVCVGYTMADAVRDAAELYPDQKFAIIDDDSNEDLDNVTCLMFAQEQASYLAGLAAGYTTESNIVGFVIGASNETMNAYGYGYLAGVLDANPDAEILQFNANSFYDTAIGKSAVNIMVTKGADIIFHAAGSTGLGVIN